MTLAHWAGISALVVELGYGLMVYLTNARRAVNQFFLVLALALGCWLTCVHMVLLSTSPEAARFWLSQSFLCGTFLPSAFYLLRAAIVHPSEPWWRIVVRARWFLLSVVPFAVLCETDGLIRAVEFSRTPLGDWTVVNPRYGWAFGVVSAYMVGYVLFLLVRLGGDTHQLQGLPRLETQFVLLATGASFVVGLTFTIIIPAATGSSWMAPLAPSGVIVLNAIMAYGIATRRIMGVAAVLQRATGYALLTGYLSVIYFAALYAARALFRALALPSTEAPHFLATLATAISVAPAQGRIQRLARRLFLSEQPADFARTVQQAGQRLQTIATMEELLQLFADMLAGVLNAERVVLLLADDGGVRQAFPAPLQAPPLTLGADTPLFQALARGDEPLVAEVILRRHKEPLRTDAARALADLGFAAAMGIQYKRALSGAVLLGPRLSGHVYSVAEQDILRVLCGQFAVALENAKLYTEAQNRKIYNDILVDSLVSGVIAADVDRRIIVFNREAGRITRLTAAQTLHQPIAVLPEPLRRAMEEAYATGQDRRDQEVCIVFPGPEEGEADRVFARLGVSALRGHTGESLGVLLVFHDFTYLRRLQEQVRRADRLASMGTLSAGMAHEIKNPLVTIKTFTQLLPERYNDPDFRETFVTLVADEVKRIDGIVNQVLSFARPAKPQLAEMHVHEALDKALRLVAQELQRKQIAIVRDYAAADDLIRGDEELLGQAFVNFFLNAYEAMGDGGRLRVATRCEAPRRPAGAAGGQAFIRIDIADTGVGIKEADLARIFDPFFTTKSQGTGLGLTVSHGIVYDHRGTIHVESQVGRGTTLRVSLPLLSDAPAKESAA